MKTNDDLDRSLLVVVPDAPRIAEQGFPPSFDWKILPAKFYDTMKPSYSEKNLSTNANENGMKSSSSAFEILSRSNSELKEEEPEPVVKEQEVVVKKSAKKSHRPKTFR